MSKPSAVEQATAAVYAVSALYRAGLLDDGQADAIRLIIYKNELVRCAVAVKYNNGDPMPRQVAFIVHAIARAASADQQAALMADMAEELHALKLREGCSSDSDSDAFQLSDEDKQKRKEIHKRKRAQQQMDRRQQMRKRSEVNRKIRHHLRKYCGVGAGQTVCS